MRAVSKLDNFYVQLMKAYAIAAMTTSSATRGEV